MYQNFGKEPRVDILNPDKQLERAVKPESSLSLMLRYSKSQRPQL